MDQDHNTGKTQDLQGKRNEQEQVRFDKLTELRAKGTPLHDAVVVGDTVGDPFKDTSSVALNPVIKFTTLFGLLAVEMAVGMKAGGHGSLTLALAAVFLAINLVFVYRSFYCMRINVEIPKEA